MHGEGRAGARKGALESMLFYAVVGLCETRKRTCEQTLAQHLVLERMTVASSDLTLYVDI